MKTDIKITFSNGIRENGNLRFHPGETMQGYVTIIPHKDITCQHVYLRLLWHTKGLGDRFMRKIAEDDIFQGTLQKDTPLRHEFTFTLPKEPWSYTGKLLSIVWGVEVQVDVPRARDLEEKTTFVLHPYGARAMG